MDCQGERVKVVKPLETISVTQVRVRRSWVEAGVRRGRVRLGRTWWKENRQCVLWERKKEG